VILSIIILCLMLAMMTVLLRAIIRQRSLITISGRSGSHPPVSVIVPFRDEAGNLTQLIERLEHLKISETDKLEFLFVNDHSTDSSNNLIPDRIQGVPVTLIQLPEGIEGKKSALASGINAASGTWIVTVDADVQISEKWLQMLLGAIDAFPGAKMLVLPVAMQSKGAISAFWALDFQLIQAISRIFPGAPTMCNGANLAFKKEAWERVRNDVKGSKLASGDDMFLMQAIRKRYGKEAVVDVENAELVARTQAPDTLSSGLSQRIRWARKPGIYKNSSFLLFTSVFMWLGNLAWILHLVLLQWIDNQVNGYEFVLISVPVMVAMLCVFSVKPFGDDANLRGLHLILTVYPLYILALPLLALLKVRWKGRTL
jgi:cellulose synthase/poly-beta-1,6-N-acetylglucosamine synthase-like glycosyltransferase